MIPFVTSHALEQFVSRWRPALTSAEARPELEAIVAGSRPTRQRTLVGNAQLWVGLSSHGERILMAVRHGTVLTVLDRHAEFGNLRDLAADSDLAEQSRQTVAACHAMLGEDQAERQRAEDRARCARVTLRRHAEGDTSVTPRALARARLALGLPPEPERRNR